MLLLSDRARLLSSVFNCENIYLKKCQLLEYFKSKQQQNTFNQLLGNFHVEFQTTDVLKDMSCFCKVEEYCSHKTEPLVNGLPNEFHFMQE